LTSAATTRPGGLPEHPGKLGQPLDTRGVDRAAQVGVVGRPGGREGVDAGQGLDGRAAPDREQAEQLGRQPHGTSRDLVSAAGGEGLGVVRAALEGRRRRGTQQQ
jgi:hypothetical protein